MSQASSVTVDALRSMPIFESLSVERLVPLAEKLVRMQIENGSLRSDLDPKLTVLSMVSLALFPFLALPVTSRVFGVKQDEEFLQRLAQHTTELIARGLYAPTAPEKKS